MRCLEAQTEGEGDHDGVGCVGVVERSDKKWE
jgi:hypothetical protein